MNHPLRGRPTRVCSRLSSRWWQGQTWAGGGQKVGTPWEAAGSTTDALSQEHLVRDGFPGSVLSTCSHRDNEPLEPSHPLSATVVRECKRGTTGPLLPPKANPRSQSSGCEPATACLQGRRSHARRLVYIGLRAGFIRYIWNVSEPGKRCHVFLLIIPAKCHLSGYLPRLPNKMPRCQAPSADQLCHHKMARQCEQDHSCLMRSFIPSVSMSAPGILAETRTPISGWLVSLP